MIRRLLRYPAGWEWHVLLQGDNAEDEIIATKRQYPECAAWIDECGERATNHISVDTAPEAGPTVSGTLLFQISEQQSDVQPFHFWLSGTRLITMHGDMRLPLRLQSSMHSAQYEACKLAPEAFFLMLGTLLETFHSGLDGFEQRLGELERTMRHRNRTGLIDTIFERRYDLLHWSHLFIPVRELHGAAKEAFMSELTGTDAFVRISHKLERIDTLLKHYALEIDTLISMDGALSSFRGNDIMRTLTIYTVLFLPATLAGTLMGSNFDILPWRDNPWGFPGMIAGVIVITAAIYLWLWKKGWTGDLLHKRRTSRRIEAAERNAEKRRAARAGSTRSSKRRSKKAKQQEALSSSAVLSADQPTPLRSRKSKSSYNETK